MVWNVATGGATAFGLDGGSVGGFESIAGDAWGDDRLFYCMKLRVPLPPIADEPLAAAAPPLLIYDG